MATCSSQFIVLSELSNGGEIEIEANWDGSQVRIAMNDVSMQITDDEFSELIHACIHVDEFISMRAKKKGAN